MTMEIIVIIQTVLLAALLAAGVMQYRRRRADLNAIEDKDKLLTGYVAKNIDLERELSELRRDYAAQKDMTEEIRRVQEQSRALKHDMKNHTLVMLSYLEEDRIEEAKKYVSAILDKLNRMYTYVNVGNSILNYIVNRKLSKAKEQQIEIKAEIENLAFSYMDSVDFSSLLNNLFDNAIEAAAGTKRKKIAVSIAKRKGFDTINIKNSIEETVLAHNPSLQSTKAEPGHGIGMRQIREIVEKYDGILDIYEENGMFAVNVILHA